VRIGAIVDGVPGVPTTKRGRSQIREAGEENIGKRGLAEWEEEPSKC